MPSLRAVDSPSAKDLETEARKAAMREASEIFAALDEVVERAEAAFGNVLGEPWAREELRQIAVQGRMRLTTIAGFRAANRGSGR